jgi:hypothetical protein
VSGDVMQVNALRDRKMPTHVTPPCSTGHHGTRLAVDLPKEFDESIPAAIGDLMTIGWHSLLQDHQQGSTIAISLMRSSRTRSRLI